jgi:hypothetical protein
VNKQNPWWQKKKKNPGRRKKETRKKEGRRRRRRRSGKQHYDYANTGSHNQCSSPQQEAQYQDQRCIFRLRTKLEGAGETVGEAAGVSHPLEGGCAQWLQFRSLVCGREIASL